MQPMQSILTIRPDQLRTGAENIDQEVGRVKANSIESPPKSESPQKVRHGRVWGEWQPEWHGRG